MQLKTCIASYVVILHACMVFHNYTKLIMHALYSYRIRQNIRGGKLSPFSRILAKRESFTIENFPSSQLENFIIIP